MKSTSQIFLAIATLLALSNAAHAQLPITISLNAGISVPVHNEADVYENGLHVGAAAKLILIPLQIEAAYDRLSASGTGEDLSLLSGGLALPISLLPAVLPVSVYVIGGAGMYKYDAEVSGTNVGINGGAGIRLGIPGIKLFAEGRGVLVFGDENRISYLTAGLGLRF